jgi:cytochrome c oxidase subunit 4
MSSDSQEVHHEEGDHATMTKKESLIVALILSAYYCSRVYYRT